MDAPTSDVSFDELTALVCQGALRTGTLEMMSADRLNAAISTRVSLVCVHARNRK